MFTPIIQVLNYISISQLLLFSVFFYLNRNGNRLSNRILATLFLCYALWLSTYYLNWLYYDFLYEHLPQVIGVFFIFDHTIGPLLFLYTCSLIYKDFRLKGIHLVFFIPFFYQLVIILFRLVLQPLDEKLRLLKDGCIYGHWEYYILFSILYLLNIIFALYAFKEIGNYRKKAKDFLTSTEKLDLGWLVFILSGLTLVFIFDSVNFVYESVKKDYLHFRDIVFFIMYFNFNGLIYIGLRKSNVFYRLESRVKYEKSTLSENDKKSVLAKLRARVEKEKYYLIPTLTLQEIADRTSMQARHISQVINELTDQNFYDFINSYRVEEAKRLLVDPAYKSFSMLGVLFEAGFNSKTAFNTAFKKHTGLTPRVFQKMAMEDRSN